MAALFALFQGRTGKNKQYYRIVREVFGFRPNNIELYKLALIHRSASFITGNGIAVNNERLEFLGDSILSSIVTDYLFTEYPEENEGFLTQMRSKIVSRATLNQLGADIGLGNHVITHQSNGHQQKHLYGDAMEAMIGAIYLDKGYNFVNGLVINSIFRKHLDLQALSHTETDYKSRLIEWGQKSRQEIRFETKFSEKSTSREPDFLSTVVIDGREVGYGNGSTKKQAEQNAAYAIWQITSDRETELLMDRLDELTVE